MYIRGNLITRLAITSVVVFSSALAVSTKATASVTEDVAITCSGGTPDAVVLAPSTLSLNVGDVIRFTNNTGAPIGTMGTATGATFLTPQPIPNGQTGTITVTGTGNITLGGGPCSSAQATLSWIVSGGGGTSSDSASSSAPAPVTQQFGMPATSTCDEAQPEGLDWAGVASGGWGVSWAQWMNGGNGGAVCTRTLVYSTTQSRWVVG